MSTVTPDEIARLRKIEVAAKHAVWAFDNDDGTIEHDFRPDNALEKLRCIVTGINDAKSDEFGSCEHSAPFICEPCWTVAVEKKR